MCIVVEPAELHNTRILVVAGKTGRQLTVYQNKATTAKTNAMILPVPSVAGLTFVDMTDYKRIFEDMDRCFPPKFMGLFGGGGMGSTLKVHTVGSYKASIVPTFADFTRLDECFRTNGTVGAILEEHYPGYGFVVCQLDAGQRDYEPFAYLHPIVGDRVFIPTRHYHGDGPPETVSDWDHVIYTVGCMLSSTDQAGWCSGAVEKLCRHADLPITESFLSRMELTGRHPNCDFRPYVRSSHLVGGLPVFVGKDGCHFYSDVEGLQFVPSQRGGTELRYKGRQLQMRMFIDEPLTIMGRTTTCKDRGDGFTIEGLRSGNVCSYVKDQPGLGFMQLSA